MYVRDLQYSSLYRPILSQNIGKWSKLSRWNICRRSHMFTCFCIDLGMSEEGLAETEHIVGLLLCRKFDRSRSSLWVCQEFQVFQYFNNELTTTITKAPYLI